MLTVALIIAATVALACLDVLSSPEPQGVECVGGEGGAEG